MLSNGNESSVYEAGESVESYVDEILLIDCGIEDETVEVVRSCFGERMTVLKYDWANDFADARNFALDAAKSLNADWAFTIDSDERLEFANNFTRDDLHDLLAKSTNIDTWLVFDSKQGYAKERIIRTASPGRWFGRTHEAFIGVDNESRRVFEDATFWEIQKSPDELQLKFERDYRVLCEMVEDHPNDPRWWLYLGETAYGRKQYAEALEHIERGLSFERWDEQATWGLFTTARCTFELNRFEETVERCCMGLSYNPCSPELLWLAGVACCRLGEVRKGITWAEMALTCSTNPELSKGRIGFRYIPAWHEGPYDILRHAYKSLGNLQLAERAEAQYTRRKSCTYEFKPN